VKVEDLQQIIDRGVMMTPAVFIDGEAKIVGRVPSPDDIKKILQKEEKKT
jgi:predicted thioredoxin/glutaredoxin